MRKSILIANCYFDDGHGSVRRPRKVPYAMGPVYLAGALSSLCDVRLYNEVARSVESVSNVKPVLGHGGPGGRPWEPCHGADDPWHLAPILSERAG